MWEQPRYFWGDAWYHDLFDGTPEHHFSFCYRGANVLGNPLNPRTPGNPTGNDVDFAMHMHTEHNS